MLLQQIHSRGQMLHARQFDELSEMQGHSTEVQVLQSALKRGPIFYAVKRDSDLVLNEIYSISSRGDRYASGAGERLAGRPYAVVEFKAPGYNSVNGKDGIGDGWGNGSFTIPDDDGEKSMYVKKMKIWSDQPKFLVVYTFKGLEPTLEEHDKRMEAA
jgi:hypothetical protein